MSYTENWSEWIAISNHQHHKDRLLFPLIARHFRPGRILEIGAGVGQLTKMANLMGFDCLASDLEDNFVTCMKRQGIPALKLDALALADCASAPFSTVFAQGLSTLVTKDLAIVEATYRSICQVLDEQGLFVFIFPSVGSRSARWSTLDDHRKIYRRSGFRELLVFRQQLFPSIVYRKLFTLRPILSLLEQTIGRYLGIRYVIILQKTS